MKKCSLSYKTEQILTQVSNDENEALFVLGTQK